MRRVGWLKLAAVAASCTCVAALVSYSAQAPRAPQESRRHRERRHADEGDEETSSGETPDTRVQLGASASDSGASQRDDGTASWFDWLNPFKSEVELELKEHPQGVPSVGPWKEGDPWPAGAECKSGLTNAYRMGPEKGCEPNCVTCAQVCIPGAFLGPFKNHGGEVGGNCFERGCLDFLEEGKRSGVTFFKYSCDPELQKKWKELSMQGMTEEQAKQNLDGCLSECKKRDKECAVKCEETHKEEVATIAIQRHKATGFQGEHGDAYEVGSVMGMALLFAVAVGVAGCFYIHLSHTRTKTRPEAPLASLDEETAMRVKIQGKVIQVATSPTGELCALTDDGRVYTWTAKDAVKPKGELNARPVEGGKGKMFDESKKRPATPKTRSGGALGVETKPVEKAVELPEDTPEDNVRDEPAAGDAQAPVPAPSAKPISRKQTISELKKQVKNTRG